MKNKTCGECKHYGDASFKDPCAWVHDTFDACFEFEPMTEPKLTNGDVIRQMSNAELAKVDKCDFCTYFDGVLCIKPDDKCCADGIEPYLNAPAETEREEKDE